MSYDDDDIDYSDGDSDDRIWCMECGDWFFTGITVCVECDEWVCDSCRPGHTHKGEL